MSICVLPDTHFASVARTLIATELTANTPTYYLSSVLADDDGCLTEEGIKQLATDWRTLNQRSYIERYPPEYNQEPEVWENLPIETFEGRTLSPIELIKALYSIQYQVNDYCTDHLTQEGEKLMKTFQCLIEIIAEIAEHIIIRLPDYQKADSWCIPNDCF